MATCLVGLSVVGGLNVNLTVRDLIEIESIMEWAVPLPVVPVR